MHILKLQKSLFLHSHGDDGTNFMICIMSYSTVVHRHFPVDFETQSFAQMHLVTLYHVFLVILPGFMPPIKSIPTLSVPIVNALFIKDKLDMLFMQEDLKKLTEAIKNCISSLWTTYHEYHKQLGETGHGLIVLDHEHEIMLGSEIVNVYDLIKVKLPWY
ncbi:hypothetical protein V8B97DRAFT_1914315 [Scleroderma yunnanense]